jgi:hypothetical protein
MEIALTQGQIAVIDDEDWPLISTYKWFALHNGGNWYARTTRRNETGRKTVISMHRLLLGLPSGKEVDHRDGNGLNNRRQNLRTATSLQNNQNQRHMKPRNTSGFKGVSFHKQCKTWRADIRKDGKLIYLGLFPTKASAAQAYDDAARQLFGEFAAPNFPDGASRILEMPRKPRYWKTTNTSGFKGVTFLPARHLWRARITLHNQRIHLGYFASREAAAQACDAATAQNFTSSQ